MGLEELITKENLEAIKPVAGFLANIAMKLLSSKKDTMEILMRLGQEKGRPDFSEEHVRVIGMINAELSKGDIKADLDKFSFYELLLAAAKGLESINTENYKNFENDIIRATQKQIMMEKGVSEEDIDSVTYIDTISKDAFDEVDNMCKKETISQISDYKDKINYNLITGNKSDEYALFYKQFMNLVLKEARIQYDMRQLEFDSSYTCDNEDEPIFYTTVNGDPSSVDIDVFIKRFFASSIDNDTNLGREYIQKDVNANVTGRHMICARLVETRLIMVDLKSLDNVSSGVVSAFINIYKILQSGMKIDNRQLNVYITKKQLPQIKYIKNSLTKGLEFIVQDTE